MYNQMWRSFIKFLALNRKMKDSSSCVLDAVFYYCYFLPASFGDLESEPRSESAESSQSIIYLILVSRSKQSNSVSIYVSVCYESWILVRLTCSD